jgi:prevent-host-death family protein
MSDAGVEKVGARELRHDLRAILDRVWEGERFEVTDRGKPVARLVPIPGRETLLERLVADGKLRPPKRPLHPLPPLLPPGKYLMTGEEALELEREERLP